MSHSSETSQNIPDMPPSSPPKQSLASHIRTTLHHFPANLRELAWGRVGGENESSHELPRRPRKVIEAELAVVRQEELTNRKREGTLYDALYDAGFQKDAYDVQDFFRPYAIDVF